MVSVITHPTCTVRAARPDDGDSMAALAVQLGYHCTGAEVRRRLDEMSDPARFGVFVAVLPEGKVVGWVGVYLYRAIELEALAEINGLVVEETLRSQGMGKVLLQAAEDWAQRAGCVAISVHSNATRERAHHFYLNNGFGLLKTHCMFHKLLRRHSTCEGNRG